MMKKLIPLIMLALISGAAMAGDKDKPMRETAAATFEALDQNHDQRISQSEAAGDQNVAGRFAALDADGDGALTKREFAAGAKPDKSQQHSMPEQPRPDPYNR
jgi:Ca2+-binding EF-hand superfamily protein